MFICFLFSDCKYVVNTRRRLTEHMSVEMKLLRNNLRELNK